VAIWITDPDMDLDTDPVRIATLVRCVLAEVCTVPVLLVVTVSLSSTVSEILSLVCQNVEVT